MWNKKSKLCVGIVVAVIALLVLTGAASTQQQTDSENKSISIIKQYGINDIVKEIETVHCKMTDKQLSDIKLSEIKIKEVRAFCKKPRQEKINTLESAFKKIDTIHSTESQIIGFENSYSCTWDGYNTGIPTYRDLGLTSTSCSWHDSSSQSCKVQGALACLWGCTNTDPLLGWHTAYFSSRTALENLILPKGYSRVTNPAEGRGYRRALPYGYSYELIDISVDSNGKGTWHIEGPEPDPRFNWPGFLGTWWPVEVLAWHYYPYNC